MGNHLAPQPKENEFVTGENSVEDLTQLQPENPNIFETIPLDSEPKIHFNVGGQQYSTMASTLGREPESVLAQMIKSDENREKIENGQELFIDRDGQLFGQILNYLRDGDQWILPSEDEVRNCLLREAEYFKLDELAHWIKSAQNMKMAVR